MPRSSESCQSANRYRAVLCVAQDWVRFFMIMWYVLPTLLSLLLLSLLMWCGVVWCGMQVHDIVRTVDLDCDGYVSWDEFKHAFFKPSKGFGV